MRVSAAGDDDLGFEVPFKHHSLSSCFPDWETNLISRAAVAETPSASSQTSKLRATLALEGGLPHGDWEVGCSGQREPPVGHVDELSTVVRLKGQKQ